MNKKVLNDEIIRVFNFEGTFISEDSLNIGNINDTFILSFEDENKINKYIVQRINNIVFTNPEALMENIKKITLHISNKVKEDSRDILRESLNLVTTKEEKVYYKSSKGEYWRAFLYIDGARTYEKAENPEHIYEAGKALGKFQKQLSDFKAEELFEVIKDFHNTPKRYNDFLKAVEEDKANRVKDVLGEISFIMNRADDLSKLVNLFNDEMIPLRVTHNDTKFNNIMIDNESGEAICVIDLDTVMLGLSLYDFGDAIRSGCSTTEEDEKDLSKVEINIDLYEKFIKGLLKESKETLNSYEIENIAFSAKIITMELAMRFLGDYLNGDIYFKIMRENHNLERARNQLKLAEEIEKNLDLMNEIIKKYS